MSLLANLATDDTIENEKDSVGSGGLVESGLYPSTISLAYMTKSAGGATGMVLHAKTEAGNDIKQTLWVTSGTAKGGKTFYEKDGVKHYLPGFLLANSIGLLTVGKELAQLEPETKVVNVYSAEAKAEVPTKVEMLVELLGQDILLGVIKQTVDKSVKNDAGVYVPTGETREENEIDKAFKASTRMTTAEIRGQAEAAAFVDVWAEKHTGKTRNKATKTGNAGTAGAPKAAATGTAKPKSSLFA